MDNVRNIKRIYNKIINRKVNSAESFDNNSDDKDYPLQKKFLLKNGGGYPRGVIVKAMDCGIVVR